MRLPLVLDDMTVLEVRETLKTVKTALLPVGCVEQHGYHLPIATDSLTAEYVCGKTAKQRPVVLLPTQRYSFSGGFLEGTVQIQPKTVYHLTRDILESLYAQGFRGVVIISGHGGGRHVASIKDAVSEMTLSTGDYYIAFACVGAALSPKCREVQRPDRRNVSHATETETAMIQAIAPHLVREEMFDRWEDREALREPIDDIDKFIDQRVRQNDETFDAKVEIGVGSYPKPSKNGYGQEILDDCVNTVIQIVDRVNGYVS